MLNTYSLEPAAIFQDLRRKRWLYTALGLLVFSATLFFHANERPRYEASLLGKVEENDQQSLISSAYSSLASVAGLPFGRGASQEKTHLALTLLRTQRFQADFIDYLNAEKQQPHTLSNLQSLIREPLDEVAACDYDDNWRQRLEVEDQVFKGFFRMNLSHELSHCATYALVKLVGFLNEQVRERDLSQAEESIAYLKKELTSADSAEIRTLLTALLRKQSEIRMLASVRSDYVFSVLDPPLPPEKPKNLSLVVKLLLAAIAIAMMVLAEAIRATALSPRRAAQS